jgi:hypothetical protein
MEKASEKKCSAYKHHQNKLPDYCQNPSLSTDLEDCRVVG